MTFDLESRLSVWIESDGLGEVSMVSGELARDTTLLFTRCLSRALKARHSPLRVDLSDITYLDVAGYRAIMDIDQRYRRRNIALVWLQTSNPVWLLFRTLGAPARVISPRSHDFEPIPTAGGTVIPFRQRSESA